VSCHAGGVRWTGSTEARARRRRRPTLVPSQEGQAVLDRRASTEAPLRGVSSHGPVGGRGAWLWVTDIWGPCPLEGLDQAHGAGGTAAAAGHGHLVLVSHARTRGEHPDLTCSGDPLLTSPGSMDQHPPTCGSTREKPTRTWCTQRAAAGLPRPMPTPRMDGGGRVSIDKKTASYTAGPALPVYVDGDVARAGGVKKKERKSTRDACLGCCLSLH
jgi:hypothetical protein